MAPKPGGSGDQTFSGEAFSGVVAAVTSAFGDPTRRDIYLRVREVGEATASEVAEHFALHANVARHHLEKLTAGGYLTVELARVESAGRPSKRYRAADDLLLPFPPKRDDLLASLLVRALDRLGPEAAAELADEIGEEYGRALAAKMGPAEGHRSVRSALTTVAEALTAHGFAAHADRTAGSLAIVSECCPFGDAAQEHPHVICAIDRGMIRGMLAGLYGDTHPHFEASRPDGDDHCVARV